MFNVYVLLPHFTAVCCYGMPAKIHWTKVHRTKFRDHQKIRPLDPIETINTP